MGMGHACWLGILWTGRSLAVTCLIGRQSTLRGRAQELGESNRPCNLPCAAWSLAFGEHLGNAVSMEPLRAVTLCCAEVARSWQLLEAIGSDPIHSGVCFSSRLCSLPHCRPCSPCPPTFPSWVRGWEVTQHHSHYSV